MDEPFNDLDEATKCVISDPERSLAICDLYLREHPGDVRGFFCRFQAWEELGEFENALTDINLVVELDPSWLGYFSRGAFFHNFGHYERAVNDLTRARELDTEGSAVSSISCYRADSLARLGRIDEALADCGFLPDNHLMPALNGLPEGNRQQFIEEIKRRAFLAKNHKCRSGPGI